MSWSRATRKVFCIGAHRTGTRSLAKALDLLGFNCCHWESHKRVMDDVRAGNFALSVMEEYDAAADFPIPSIYRELDAAFPGSRFILTVRNRQAWLESVRKHLGHRGLAEEEQLFYGVKRFDAELFLRRFDEHNESVREYFAGRSDLLVIDVTAGEGWEKLAPFLGVPVPQRPFPNVRERPRVTPIAPDS